MDYTKCFICKRDLHDSEIPEPDTGDLFHDPVIPLCDNPECMHQAHRSIYDVAKRVGFSDTGERFTFHLFGMGFE